MAFDLRCPRGRRRNRSRGVAAENDGDLLPSSEFPRELPLLGPAGAELAPVLGLFALHGLLDGDALRVPGRSAPGHGRPIRRIERGAGPVHGAGTGRVRPGQLPDRHPRPQGLQEPRPRPRARPDLPGVVGRPAPFGIDGDPAPGVLPLLRVHRRRQRSDHSRREHGGDVRARRSRGDRPGPVHRGVHRGRRADLLRVRPLAQWHGFAPGPVRAASGPGLTRAPGGVLHRPGRPEPSRPEGGGSGDERPPPRGGPGPITSSAAGAAAADSTHRSGGTPAPGPPGGPPARAEAGRRGRGAPGRGRTRP